MRIVCGTDVSDQAAGACLFAAHQARRPGDTPVLVHALEPTPDLTYPIGPTPLDAWRKAAREKHGRCS